MNLPVTVALTSCDSGSKELARIETLGREAAKQQIDAVWWNGLAASLRDPADEPDRHWEWRVIVSKYQNKPYFQAKCVKSQDGLIQAAILFRVDALSTLEDGRGAVFVDRLATAPRNRDKLIKAPVFRGGGTGLLTYAIALSYSLGFKGRVNLFPVANEDFYANKGFERTNETEGEDTLFELPASSAIGFLKARGLIDG